MTERERYARLLNRYRRLQAAHEKLLRRRRRKRVEFSKVILAVYAFVCIGWIEQTFILAFLEKQEVNGGVTVAIVSTLAAAIVGYYAKSAFEKHSRNEHRLDEFGRPYDCDGDAPNTDDN